jgi:hypothetical protein
MEWYSDFIWMSGLQADVGLAGLIHVDVAFFERCGVG